MIKVVYTNPYYLKGEIEKINDLFEAGLDELHVRKPGYSKSEMTKFIQQVDFKNWSKIVLHSHFDLVLKFNLRGIHVSPTKRRKWSFQWKRVYYRFLKGNIQISTTTSNLDKFYKFYNFDKVFLGPLFNTSYRSDTLFAFEESQLRKELKNDLTEVYAVGGINADNINRVYDLGFKGFALQSTIWKAVDPILAFHEVLSADEIGRLAS